jgi:hypothetical protein
MQLNYANAALCMSELAPGGVPTMVINDNACLLVKRGALETIASKLAPTEAESGPLERVPVFGQRSKLVEKTQLGDFHERQLRSLQQ